MSHHRRGHRIWRLILTTTKQPTGAPLIDSGLTIDADGNRYRNRTVFLTPWRRNEHGEHLSQDAFVIGWTANHVAVGAAQRGDEQWTTTE